LVGVFDHDGDLCARAIVAEAGVASHGANRLLAGGERDEGGLGRRVDGSEAPGHGFGEAAKVGEEAQAARAWRQPAVQGLQLAPIAGDDGAHDAAAAVTECDEVRSSGPMCHTAMVGRHGHRRVSRG